MTLDQYGHLFPDDLDDVAGKMDDLVSGCAQNVPKKEAGQDYVLTCFFLVEPPGIEPGSNGTSSRLLRAQSAMPLLGSPDHANKSG